MLNTVVHVRLYVAQTHTRSFAANNSHTLWVDPGGTASYIHTIELFLFVPSVLFTKTADRLIGRDPDSLEKHRVVGDLVAHYI